MTSATMTVPMVLAQTTQPGTATNPPAAQPDIWHSWLIPAMLIVVVMWIFSMRASRKKQKDKQSMIDNMKRGDRVQTIGGILGTVVEAREKEVIVKVDEGNNTKIKFARGAIDRVLDEEKV